MIKVILNTILKTAEPNDWFNIIEFSDTAKVMFSQNQSKLVSLKDESKKYKNSTISFEEAVIKNLSISESFEANYFAALDLTT